MPLAGMRTRLRRWGGRACGAGVMNLPRDDAPGWDQAAPQALVARASAQVPCARVAVNTLPTPAWLRTVTSPP